MTIHSQVCFHRWLFAERVKPHWCITRPVGPLGRTNQSWCGVKLLKMSVSTHPVGCVHICHLLRGQHHSMHPNGSFNNPVLRLMTLQNSQTMSVTMLLLLQICTTALITQNFRLVYVHDSNHDQFICSTLFECGGGYFPSFVPIYPKTLSAVSPIKHLSFQSNEMKVCSYMDTACVIY